MEHQRRLVAWIGHHDLWGMAEECGGQVAESVRRMLGPDRRGDTRGKTGRGPIMNLVCHISFERIHLLSDYENHPEKYGDSSKSVIERFSEWIRPDTQVHRV